MKQSNTTLLILFIAIDTLNLHASHQQKQTLIPLGDQLCQHVTALQRNHHKNRLQESINSQLINNYDSNQFKTITPFHLSKNNGNVDCYSINNFEISPIEQSHDYQLKDFKTLSFKANNTKKEYASIVEKDLFAPKTNDTLMLYHPNDCPEN